MHVAQHCCIPSGPGRLWANPVRCTREYLGHSGVQQAHVAVLAESHAHIAGNGCLPSLPERQVGESSPG